MYGLKTNLSTTHAWCELRFQNYSKSLACLTPSFDFCMQSKSKRTPSMSEPRASLLPSPEASLGNVPYAIFMFPGLSDTAIFGIKSSLILMHVWRRPREFEKNLWILYATAYPAVLHKRTELGSSMVGTWLKRKTPRLGFMAAQRNGRYWHGRFSRRPLLRYELKPSVYRSMFLSAPKLAGKLRRVWLVGRLRV